MQKKMLTDGVIDRGEAKSLKEDAQVIINFKKEGI